MPTSDAADETAIASKRPRSGFASTLYAANDDAAMSTRSGPLELETETLWPEPSRMTTTTPANATARPAARRREKASRPRPSDIVSAIAGAPAMTTLAVPAVVVRSPAFRARW